MRHFALFISLLFFGLSASAKDHQLIDPTTLKPSREHRQAAQNTAKFISNYHYINKALNDELSEEILESYIKALDSSKLFFTKKDIDNFNEYKHALDDAIIRGLPDPAFNIFRIFRKKVESRIDHAVSLLNKKFDFKKKERYEFRRKETKWAANEIELDEVWRKKVKNDLLNLRLDDSTKPEEVVKTLTKRYKQIKHRTQQIDSNKIFEYFMNAYTTTIEPHTGFMSPRTTENFDINMRLSLEGIGAILQEKDGYTVVKKPVAGGPADLSHKIHSGDRIVGVGQGEKGEIEDIVGWTLDDVVDKIRGKKGSTVRLKILPKKAQIGGTTKIVKIVRAKIKLEDRAAKSEIIKVNDKKIGLITLETFYLDFAARSRGEKNYRSTTRDVKKILTELKKKKVDGVVIDLRNNGGGSLDEAVELTGLFIKTGPVVQVKSSADRLEVKKDLDESQIYTGPLAVLINRNSASASEIFAGAIKDYKRGIIIGEPTFGKGTVQALINLSQRRSSYFSFLPKKPLGSIRLTTAQFFRINGDSTQYRGVLPNVAYPEQTDLEETGEAALENALPFVHIDPADYQPINNNYHLAEIIKKHQDRIKQDDGFKYLAKQHQIFKEIKDIKSVSLVEEVRKKEWETREKESKKIRNAFRIARGLKALPDDIDQEKNEELKEKEDEADAKAIKKIGSVEAANILNDYIHASTPPLTAKK